MNGIMGMNKILPNTDLSPIQHDYVNTIQPSAESLLVLINDILDLSKIEAEIEEKPFDLNELLHELRWDCCQCIRKRITLGMTTTIPQEIIGDRSRPAANITQPPCTPSSLPNVDQYSFALQRASPHAGSNLPISNHRNSGRDAGNRHHGR